MDWNRVEGNWKQVKGQIKEKWGQLTDDDLNVIAGRLVPVLQEWELQRLTINIAYPTRRHLPAKVRCFVDFLVEQFEKQDFERRWTA